MRRFFLRDRKLKWFKCSRKEYKNSKKKKVSKDLDTSEDDSDFGFSDNEASNNQEVLQIKKNKSGKSDKSGIRGIINFDHYECTIERSKNKDKCFEIKISGINQRCFQFKAISLEQCNVWAFHM
jgi:hypothetical protein